MIKLKGDERVKCIAYKERREIRTKFCLDNLKGADNLGDFDMDVR
jgi:hypothetical protein